MNFNDNPRGGTMVLSKAGIAIGDGAKTGVAVAAPNGAGIDFCIDGYMYHKADSATNVPLTGSTVPVLSTVLYTVCLTSGGTVSFVQGTPVLNAKLAGGTHALYFPQPTAGTVAIGGIKIVLTNAQTFVPGTTAMDVGADCTVTYYDFCTLPTNPITA